MAKNFPNLRKKMDIQFQETQRTTTGITSRRPTLGHITTKLSNSKTQRETLKFQDKYVYM